MALDRQFKEMAMPSKLRLSGAILFDDPIMSVIKARIKEATDKAIENAKKEIERDLTKIVAEVSISIFKQLEISSMNDGIHIHIKFPKENL